MRRRRRPAGRRPAVSTQSVRHLPARFAPLPQPQGQAKIFPGGRSCASADPANSRPTQALGPLGRPLRHQQGTRQRLLLPDRCTEAEGTQERRLRQGVGTTMERQPPSKILQLKAVCIMLPFLLNMRQTGPRGTLGNGPPLSLNDECHTHECIITFDFLSGTGFE